jgi:putative peptidoglycan lipid II flippase
MRAGLMSFDARLKTSAVKLALAGLALAAALLLAAAPVTGLTESAGSLRLGGFQLDLKHVAALLALALLGAAVYGGAVAAMFGPRWLAAFRRRRARSAL